MSYNINTLQLGPMENFIYLIQDAGSNRAAVIDPAWEVLKIIDTAHQKGLQITDVLLTHSHYDHTNGLSQLLEISHPQVHLSKAEAHFWASTLHGQFHLHEEGDVIELGETKIKVWHTPGHTPGSVCYYLEGHVFTGDTLFVFSCGRCDLRGGDPDQMYQSLKRLGTQLPLATIVHPGHHYANQWTSTIAEEKEGNPFMQFDNHQDFLDYRMYKHDQERNTPYEPMKKPE